MWNDENNKKHLKNVQNETDNPAILNDVIGETALYPDNEKDSALSAKQEIIRNNTDGKTWQNE